MKWSRVAGVVVLVTAGLTALPSRPAAATAQPTTAQPTTAQPTTAHIDATVAGQLRDARPGMTFPVIARFDRADRADGLGFPVRRYASFPVAAARLSRAEIDALAARPGTLEIGPDRVAHKTMDTARAGFGVDNAASDYGVTGAGVTVAVLDTGIDATHADFSVPVGKLRFFQNFVSDPTGCPAVPANRNQPFDDDDVDGHGTHVSSIIAGNGGNPQFHGVAPNASLVVLKVLNCNGDGTEADILAALDFVLQHHADADKTIRAMNLSFGFSGATSSTDPAPVAVNKVEAAGVATFMAAGNDGPALSTVDEPATARWGVAVGAMSDPGDTRSSWPPGFGLAPFSGRGPTVDGKPKPDIVAPGVEITAACASSVQFVNGGAGCDSASTPSYLTLSGTSMATPFTAGVAALMLEGNASLSPSGTACTQGPSCVDGVDNASMHEPLRDLLRSSAAPFGPPPVPNPDYGWGRLDAYAAVKAAENAPTGVLGPPAVGQHAFATGSLAAVGACDSWPISVPDAATAQFPVAVALEMTSWSSAANPNFEIEVRDQASSIVATKRQQHNAAGANIETREEVLGFRPGIADYTLRVRSVAGSGPYQFDISGGIIGARQACPGLVENPDPVTGIRYTEGGAPSYTVKLDHAPTSNVTVNLSAPSYVTLSPTSLVFTPANSSTPQPVSVTTTDDLIASGTRTGVITRSLASGDASFNGAPTIPMPVTVDDNDTLGVVLNGTTGALAEGSADGVGYLVSLHSQPTAPVTVQIGPDAQVTTTRSSLTFTAANWQSPQGVTVQAVDDPFVEPSPHAGHVHHTASGGGYNGVVVPDFVASITDNDGHGLSGGGYRMVASDGGIFAFGNAGFFGSTGGIHLNQPIVGMATTPSGQGYWLVARDGGIFAFGDARFFGSTGGSHLNQPIVGMASTPAGGGYWLVASDGGIFAFGDAQFFGSTGGTHLNRPIVGMAATPSGQGYWLVASDGGMFTFGNAGFAGSTGGLHLNSPVIAMAPTPDGGGYWLLASDGGIFTFGNAGFVGSTGSRRLNAPIVGFAATPFGGGYWLVASDGGIFAFGDAQFFGSTGGTHLNRPIVQMSA